MAVKLTDVFSTDGNLPDTAQPSNMWHGKTVTIGTQTWMAENLNVTHYNDGTSIPCLPATEEGTSNGWINTTDGAYVTNPIHPQSGSIYGNLYNWAAVDNAAGLAPEGWHIPTNAEWYTLTDYVDSVYGSGAAPFAGSLYLWEDGGSEGITGPAARDVFAQSGFNALPGGYRGSDGGYYSLNEYAHFWTSDEDDPEWDGDAHYWTVGYTNTLNGSDSSKISGRSVRCIKDYDPEIGLEDYS